MINIYYFSKTFGNETVKKIKKLMDDFVISQIDYKLIDISEESPKKLRTLYLFLEKLKSKTDLQKESKGKILSGLEQLEKIQKEIEYQVNNRMMIYEWIILLVLCSVLLFCLFSINTNSTIISKTIVALLSTAVVFLLLILNELDSLTWQEKNWIWKPLSQLFNELDLTPYYPEEIFKQNRLKLSQLRHLEKIRVAHYPNPYPDMTGKKVEIVKL